MKNHRLAHLALVGSPRPACRRISGSSALNGSSNSMISGSVARLWRAPRAAASLPTARPGSAGPGRRGRRPRAPRPPCAHGPRARSALEAERDVVDDPTVRSSRCWKTMLILRRRTSRSRSGGARGRSSPSIRISRGRVVEPVDHPDQASTSGPDMTTKTSPGATSRRRRGRDDAPAGLGELRAGGRRRAADLLPVRAVDLPDPAATSGISAAARGLHVRLRPALALLMRERPWPADGHLVPRAHAQGSRCADVDQRSTSTLAASANRRTPGRVSSGRWRRDRSTSCRRVGVAGARSPTCPADHRTASSCSRPDSPTTRGTSTSMPAALTFPIGNRFYDWKYESEPEPHMHGRRIYHARGKVLGARAASTG